MSGGRASLNSDNSAPPKTAVVEVVQVAPTPKRKKYIRLGTMRQIRFELAAIYRAARNGEMESGEATRFTYILTQLANMTMDTELAERVDKLERGE